MDNRVKEFLEDNRDLIKYGNWKNLFKNLIKEYPATKSNVSSLTLYVLNESPLKETIEESFGGIPLFEKGEMSPQDLDHYLYFLSLVNKGNYGQWVELTYSKKDSVREAIKIALYFDYNVYRWIKPNSLKDDYPNRDYIVVNPSKTIYDCIDMIRSIDERVEASQFQKVKS